MPAVTKIERLPDDPDERYRIRCGERMADAMRTAAGGEVSRKELVRRLAEQGHDVSLQSVGSWLKGSWLPRPSIQVAIAKAIGVRPRSIFDIEDAA